VPSEVETLDTAASRSELESANVLNFGISSRPCQPFGPGDTACPQLPFQGLKLSFRLRPQRLQRLHCGLARHTERYWRKAPGFRR